MVRRRTTNNTLVCIYIFFTLFCVSWCFSHYLNATYWQGHGESRDEYGGGRGRAEGCTRLCEAHDTTHTLGGRGIRRGRFRFRQVEQPLRFFFAVYGLWFHDKYVCSKLDCRQLRFCLFCSVVLRCCCRTASESVHLVAMVYGVDSLRHAGFDAFCSSPMRFLSFSHPIVVSEDEATKPALSGSLCELVWQGTVQSRFFTDFRFQVRYLHDCWFVLSFHAFCSYFYKQQPTRNRL